MSATENIAGDLHSPPPCKNSSKPPPPPPAVGRKNTAEMGVRAWLAVNFAGEARMVEAGKQAIMRRTGIPARDLRILDPMLSYPSTVLGRERAVVINLEHIKAVITAHELLLLNCRDPIVSPFVHQLQRRLNLRHGHQETEDDANESGDGSHSHDLEEITSRRSYPEKYGNVDCSEEDDRPTELDEKGKSEEATDLAISDGPKAIPFEFIALEACLEAACSCLEIEAFDLMKICRFPNISTIFPANCCHRTADDCHLQSPLQIVIAKTLENEAYPALDKLTSKISTLNLEHVRQIKSRLVALTGRVQKVRDELEHLLDDDEDMAEMYLTNKLLQQQQTNGSPLSSQSDRACSFNGERTPVEISSDENIENHSHHAVSNSNNVFGDGHESHTFSTRSSDKHPDVEELEMLLEAYFVQIDSTLNKLSTMGVVLMTATLIVSSFVVLVAIFGMNIKIDLFDENKAGTTEFVWTVGGGAAGSLLIYVVAISWCKHKGLLN